VIGTTGRRALSWPAPPWRPGKAPAAGKTGVLLEAEQVLELATLGHQRRTEACAVDFEYRAV